ncbi:MAG: sigma-70 family RNA polymerase sigma factor [Pyrinomonadaceae bacterium]
MESVALVLDNAPQQPDLIAQIRNGDRGAMRSLYVEHQRKVYSIALNYFSGDASKAEDVTQQIFLKLFTKMNFRGDSEFTTWLYRMTVNACIDESRKSRRWFGLGDWFIDYRTPSIDETIRSGEIGEQVQRVLASLKPEYRLPVVLKYVEGLSYQQIADVLGCSIGTVSSRLNRAHKMLAEKLEHLREEIF